MRVAMAKQQQPVFHPVPKDPDTVIKLFIDFETEEQVEDTIIFKRSKM